MLVCIILFKLLHETQVVFFSYLGWVILFFIVIKVLTSFVGIFLVLNCPQVIQLQINSVPCMKNSLKPALLL